MATQTIQKSGFIDMNTMLSSVADDLVAFGFTMIYDGRGIDEVITLEASPENDPLQSTQPWRIRFDLDYVKILEVTSPYPNVSELNSSEVNRIIGQIIVGTPIQLDDAGGFAVIPNRFTEEPESLVPDYVVGEIEGVLEYWKINNARPCSYLLNVTNRGFSLSITTDAEDEGRGQFWMCTQRLVNAITGDILLDGHTPVMCFYFKEMDGEYTPTQYSQSYGFRFEELPNLHVRQITVREKDVHAPTVPTIVSSFENYSGESINKIKQISISHQDEYILTVPDGINTHRHLYHNDRMDMLTYISANIIPETVVAEVHMHGEGLLPFFGGRTAPAVGNLLVGQTTGATAYVYNVPVDLVSPANNPLDSGDWLTDDAVGTMFIKRLNGTFSSEIVISYDADGNPVGDFDVALDASENELRIYQAQRCSGGYELVEDGYTEGSRILFLTTNGDI